MIARIRLDESEVAARSNAALQAMDANGDVHIFAYVQMLANILGALYTQMDAAERNVFLEMMDGIAEFKAGPAPGAEHVSNHSLPN